MSMGTLDDPDNSSLSSWNGTDPFPEYPSLDIMEPEVEILLICMYSLTALLSFVGNSTVIVVLTFGKRSSRGIRHFLINLAISDITMAIFCIPFTYTTYIFGHWIFAVGFCPFAQVMQHVSVTVSVYTLTAIGIDRYFAIMHPLKSRWTKSCWLLVLMGIWLVAFGMSSVLFVYGTADKFTWNRVEYYECIERFPGDSGQGYTICIVFNTFALPLLVLGYTYASIARKMWKHTSPGNADVERDEHQMQAKRKVVKMLALVVLLFAFCWLPLQTYIFLISVDKKMMQDFQTFHYNLSHAIFFTCHWLAMANSFVNPIIYCFMSENFWGDLRQILLHCTQFVNMRKKTKFARGRCLGSFRSTTYVLSFRTTSGSSQGAIYMKKMSDTNSEKSANYFSSVRYTTSDNQGYV